MNTPKYCQNCQIPLADNTARGLCPACLMKVAMATGTEAGSEKPRFTPPSVGELAQKFPQLEIIELIGQGGMGAVYKARQKELDRIVALKILPPGIGDETAFAERFTREAKALARLNHPGIVTIHDTGRADGLFFFVMEFVDGVTLRQLLVNGRVSPREAMAIVPQICDALQFAHDQGIVHRDIKPENILLDRRGRVKVADFGLAKIVAADPSAPSAEVRASNSSVTEAGKVMGTPAYMAPEQVKHPDDVDHRADIYALGVVFYQMLTGELPGKRVEPPSLKVHLDVRLDEVVLRALEKKPELRYQQVSDVKTAVETITITASSVNTRGWNRLNQSSAFTPPAGPVELKGRYQPVGKRVVLAMEVKQTIESRVTGQPDLKKYDFSIGFEYGFTVLKETAQGGSEMEMEILGGNVGSVSGGMVWSYDSTRKSEAGLSDARWAELFGKIVGSKILFFLKANEEVERMQGVEEFMNQVKPAPQADSLDWFRSLLTDVFSEARLRQVVKLNRFVPRTAVQRGDTWSLHEEIPASSTIAPLERDFKVTFQDWETRGKRVCARLEFKGIEKTKSDPNPNQGEATLTSIQGALSGVVWFDPDLGLTIETAAKGDLTSVKNTSPQATTSEMKQVVSAKLTLVE